MKLMKLFLLFASVFTGMTLACASSSSKSRVSSPSNEVATPQPQTANANDGKSQDARLNNEVKEIAAQANGRVGVSAVLLNEGGNGEKGNGEKQETELVSLNVHDHFPMQSVYKLPISMAVMQAVEAGRIKLADKISVSKSDFIGRAAHSPIRDKFPRGTSLTVEELLRYALVESDGTASDVLMRLAGGPAAVQAYLSGLGIKEMIVLDTEQAFTKDHSLQFRNYATPEAAVALLRALYERRGMSAASQALLLKLMTESTTGPRRLKGLLPGTPVAHKTGTSGTEKGITAATNDIGIVSLPNGKHLAIAVFVADSPADEATREGVIAKIARAVVSSVPR